MKKPRTLFLHHEQRQWYWEEPGYLELYLPMVHSGLLGECRSHPYQRDLRWFRMQHPMHQARRKRVGPRDLGAVVEEDLTFALHAVMTEFQPDLVVYSLTWASEAIPIGVLTTLKEFHKFKLFSVVWDYDEGNPNEMAYDRDIIAISDLVNVADSYERVERIRARQGLYADHTHVEAVQFMPMVADPGVFQPSREKLYDVTIAGSSEGHRIEVCNRLIAAGIKVNRVGGLMANDAYLSHGDYARALAESRIVVNTQTLGNRVQLKGRVCQTLAAGALLMEQRSSESERFLDSLGLSRLMWNDVDELIAMIRDWLARPAECAALAAFAHQQYVRAYNPKRWTAAVLEPLGLLPKPL